MRKIIHLTIKQISPKDFNDLSKIVDRDKIQNPVFSEVPRLTDVEVLYRDVRLEFMEEAHDLVQKIVGFLKKRGVE